MIIDTDTSSFVDPNPQLIAIHAVEIKDGKLTRIIFHTFINRKEHNYDYMYFFAEYSYFIGKKENLIKFIEFVGNSTIVAHNITQDIGYINKELKKCNLKRINTEKYICTMSIIKKLNVLKNYTLKNCAKFYEIYNVHHYHKGIVEATVLAIVVCKMAEKNDQKYNIHNYIKDNNILNKKRKVYVSKGKKYHLYCLCSNLKFFSIITIKEVEKIVKNICKRCKCKFCE